MAQLLAGGCGRRTPACSLGSAASFSSALAAPRAAGCCDLRRVCRHLLIVESHPYYEPILAPKRGVTGVVGCRSQIATPSNQAPEGPIARAHVDQRHGGSDRSN